MEQYKGQEQTTLDADVLEDSGCSLVLYNDDVHTFDYVIKSLVDICRHTVEQAEQCAVLVHCNGKCTVKTGSYEEAVQLALPDEARAVFAGFGILLIGFGVFETYNNYGSMAGSAVLVGSIIVCTVLIAIMLMKGTWKRFSLKDESNSRVNQIDQQNIHVGTLGRTIARLAPTGKALIDGEQVEVHAINKFIDPDRPIEVVGVEGYRIDVCEIHDDRFGQEN